MNGKCKWCGNSRDLRLGICFQCAEAESILAEGTDMYDKGYKERSAKKPLDKLKFLIQKGWHTGNVRGW